MILTGFVFIYPSESVVAPGILAYRWSLVSAAYDIKVTTRTNLMLDI